jgi:hypothetical protein
MRPEKIYIPFPPPEKLLDDEYMYDHIAEWGEQNQGKVHTAAVKGAYNLLKSGKDIQILFLFYEEVGGSSYADVTITSEDIPTVVPNAINYFESIEDYETCAWLKTMEEKMNKITKGKNNE